jgi:8-oxo-dGTP diphosphatase
MTTVVAAVITRNSRLLICQRRRDKAFPLKWEFPGGKVEAGESLTDALTREISEELGVRIEIGREVYRTQHRYAELPAPIELVFFSANIVNQQDTSKLSDEQIASELAAFNASGVFQRAMWVAAAELPKYEFLAANAPLIARIAGGGLSLE